MTESEARVWLGTFRPRLTFMHQFQMPEPYRGWCHRCNVGFMTLDRLMIHVREFHQLKGGA